MTPDFSTLKTMPGSKVLTLLHDILLNERMRVESLEKQMISIGLARRKDPARHAVELALAAAADGVLFMQAIGTAIANERAGEPPKWADTDAQKKRWRRDLDRQQRICVDFANQVRAALMVDGLTEQEREGEDDGRAP